MKKWVVLLSLCSFFLPPSVARSAEAASPGVHAAVLEDYLDQVEQGLAQRGAGIGGRMRRTLGRCTLGRCTFGMGGGLLRSLGHLLSLLS